MTQDYSTFIAGKAYSHIEAGFSVDPESIVWPLRDFQRDTVAWACRNIEQASKNQYDMFAA